MKNAFKFLTARRVGGFLLLCGAAFLLLGRWRAAFLWGNAAGPYGFFVALGWVVFPLAGAAFLLFLGTGIAWLRARLRGEGVHPAGWTVILMLGASLLLGAASFRALITPIMPLDSIRVQENTYHLAGLGALVDINYGLYACRPGGMICEQIYRSGDFSPDSLPGSRLTYDAAAGVLSVDIAGTGTIFEYTPPRRAK